MSTQLVLGESRVGEGQHQADKTAGESYSRRQGLRKAIISA